MTRFSGFGRAPGVKLSFGKVNNLEQKLAIQGYLGIGRGFDPVPADGIGV
jgi:hypothetical protein